MNGVCSAIIGDGYDVPFFIRGERGLYPDVRGTRRLTLVGQRDAVLRDAGNKRTAAEALAVYHKLWAKKLTGWDAADKDGNAATLTADSFAALHPKLWSRINDMLLGYDPGDSDEDAPHDAPDESDAVLAESEAKN